MPTNRKFKRYGYNTWFTEKKLDDKEELDETPALEGDEKLKKRKTIKNTHYKRIINQTSTINSTNKNWNQFKKIKKWNQKNTRTFVSAQ